MASSDSNDQLSEFELVLDSLSIMSDTGASVNLVSSPVHVEFIHLNGVTEPLLTVAVPQGNYTSAAATVGVSDFACVSLNPSSGSLTSAFFADNLIPLGPPASVQLPAPITITGSDMMLGLNLQVSKSASWTSCEPNGTEPFSITPTFTLSSAMSSLQSNNTAKPVQNGLKGVVSSVQAPENTFSMTAMEGASCTPTSLGSCQPPAAAGPAWTFHSDSSTLFQGVGDLSQLGTGMAADVDATLQPDGSLLAKRVSVYSQATDNLTAIIGPALYQSSAWPVFDVFNTEGLGRLKAAGENPMSVNASTTFHISSQLANVQDLPFTASFTASGLVPGQNLMVTANSQQIFPEPTFIPATSVTLIPQAINGTVTAIGKSGAFTTFTVALASYDLFQQLAVQGGQTSLLTNPGRVVVYADSNTQMLNTKSTGVGSLVRFYGLVFNDNGTLRMDCAQINDGVTE